MGSIWRAVDSSCALRARSTPTERTISGLVLIIPCSTRHIVPPIIREMACSIHSWPKSNLACYACMLPIPPLQLPSKPTLFQVLVFVFLQHKLIAASTFTTFVPAIFAFLSFLWMVVPASPFPFQHIFVRPPLQIHA